MVDIRVTGDDQNVELAPAPGVHLRAGGRQEGGEIARLPTFLCDSELHQRLTHEGCSLTFIPCAPQLCLAKPAPWRESRRWDRSAQSPPFRRFGAARWWCRGRTVRATSTRSPPLSISPR